MWDTRFVLDLIDAVYLASIRGNRPRPIDQYIDYFGGTAEVRSPKRAAPSERAGGR